MTLLRLAIPFLAALLTLLPWPAAATTSVRVLETWPAGPHVQLATNQNFYLRLAYDSDTPIHIWARPYYQGRPVDAGSNPSRVYQGQGEAIGWFFPMATGARVDEVRISAGDGRVAHTPVVAVARVEVTSALQAPAAVTPPEWVTTLLAADASAQRAEARRAMDTPTSPGDFLLIQGFGLAVLTTFLASIAFPAWGLWKWRGPWRVAAVLPAVPIALTIARIIVDTGRDPTSHNLWPFEILMVGGPCVAIMLLLGLTHRVFAQRDEHRKA